MIWITIPIYPPVCIVRRRPFGSLPFCEGLLQSWKQTIVGRVHFASGHGAMLVQLCLDIARILSSFQSYLWGAMQDICRTLCLLSSIVRVEVYPSVPRALGWFFNVTVAVNESILTWYRNACVRAPKANTESFPVGAFVETPNPRDFP